MMKYVYGPVPSRRLGNSLGVSPIPAKTCNYSCVYCQLGPTPRLCGKRQHFFPKEDILEEIRVSLETAEVDYVTFVGDGEPTLNADLGWLLRETKRLTPVPLAVISNGLLFSDREVRRELVPADLVMPSLDAADELTWRKINRGVPAVSYRQLVDGLIRARRELEAEFRLQVMLVKGMNDRVEHLVGLRKVIDRIAPDEVCITTPVRPPAESFVKAPEADRIALAEEILGSGHTYVKRENGVFNTRQFSSGRDAVLALSARHPLRHEQAAEIAKEFGDAGLISRMLREASLVMKQFDGVSYVVPPTKEKHENSSHL